MKVSIRRMSFLSRYCPGSNPRTSPAMRHAKSAASNREIGPMPLRPSSSAPHVSRVPTPQGVTSPMPVTTTLRFTARLLPGSSLRLEMLVDVPDGVGHGGDLLRVLVADLEVELLFESHHQLDCVQRVGPQVLHELGLHGDLPLVHTELLDNDALDLLLYIHRIPSCRLRSGYASAEATAPSVVSLERTACRAIVTCTCRR